MNELILSDQAHADEQQKKIDSLMKEIQDSAKEIMEKLHAAGWSQEEITDFMNTAYLGKFEEVNDAG